MHTEGGGPSQMRVLTVLVNFNCLASVQRAIASLENELPGEHHIVIWENGSDRSVCGLSLGQGRNDGAGCSIEYTGGLGNLGYAPAVNQAVTRGLVTLSPDIIHLANPDTITRPGALARLCTVLEEEGASVVGPLTLYENGVPRPSAYPQTRALTTWVTFADLRLARRMFRFRAFVQRLAHPAIGAAYGPPRDVAVVDGGYLVIGRSAWEAVGGLDPQLLLSGDDQMLCRRVRSHGGRVLYDTRAVVVHIGGVSRSARPALSILSRVHSQLHYVAAFEPGRVALSRRLIACILRVRFGRDGRDLAMYARHVPPELDGSQGHPPEIVEVRLRNALAGSAGEDWVERVLSRVALESTARDGHSGSEGFLP